METISKVMEILLEKYLPHRQPTVRRSSGDPFRVLITCLLSLRTQDKNTETASTKLFKEISAPQDIVNIPLETLEKLIFSSGHYHKKAATLKSVSKELIERFNSKVPSTKGELLSIKGVGPKTANIVLSFAFDKEVIAIDTHLHRWPNRMGWVNTKTPEQTEQEYYKFLPKEYWKEANTVIILFCKEICQPISPWCSKCPVSQYCQRVGVERSR